VSGTGILTPSATRALLERLGHRPRRQLGQNFLVDGNIVRKSLDLAQVTVGDRVVEIGPGLGTLTAALLERGAEVFAVERDPTLLAHLRDTLEKSSGGRLHLLEGDAVEHPLGPLRVTEARPFKIVANLPYAISSPWMEAVLAGPLPTRMVLMLQLEAAQRYAAEPGSKSFGAISVFLQAACRVARGHRVARGCFHPVPDVDSTLLHLEQREAPYQFSNSGRALIRGLFQHRRKQVAPLVRRLAPAAAEPWLRLLADAGVRADTRAEGIPVASWVELDRLLGAQAKGAG
jgi:16S rRNA (adenine1518-N6/adenine1519-N6)-dimethyltransferase